MTNSLVLPAGVRLATEDEIPGPVANHNENWSRVQSANLAAGYILTKTTDSRYPFYAEVNVDAPCIWKVFCDLCRGLLGNEADLIMSEIDDEPRRLGNAHTISLLDLLEPHAYQLANDGYIQFGLIDERENSFTEVFIAPTKHFEVWFKNVVLFRSIMVNHGLDEENRLEFLDQYPRTTTPLPEDKVMFRDQSELIEYLIREIVAV